MGRTKQNGSKGANMATEEALRALADDLRTYQGDPAHGERLRTALAELGQVGRLPDKHDPALLAIRKAKTLTDSKSINGDFGIGREAAPDEAEAQRLAYQAPFLGLEPDGAAAYHHPLTIDDQASIAWANYLAAHPVIPDPRMRAFLNEMLDVRPRMLWIPAAEALAAFAARGDQASQAHLLALAQEFDFIARESAERPQEARPRSDCAPCEEAKNRKHLCRHMRYALACWIARSEAPHAPPPLTEDIPAPQLPNNETDASIEILCLAGRLRAPRDQEHWLPRVAELVASLGYGPIPEEAVRLLYQTLLHEVAHSPQQAEALACVARYLSRPQWLTDPRKVPKIDDLSSWLSSLRQLAAQDADLYARLGADHPDIQPLLAFETNPHATIDINEVVLPRLRILFNPALFAAITPLAKALCVAEITTLLQHRDVCELQWSALVNAACADASTASLLVGAPGGMAGKIGLSRLIAWLTRLHESGAIPGLDPAWQARWFTRNSLEYYLPMYLLRDRAEEEPVIIALATVHHEKILNQVAVQSERQLRKLHDDPSAQVRFLWRLLQVDPLQKAFTELLNDLRGGTETSLYRLVQAIAEMDRVRDLAKTATDRPAAEFASVQTAYQALADATVAHLNQQPEQTRETVTYLQAARASVAHLHETICTDQERTLSDCCEQIRLALVGTGTGAPGASETPVGLAAWFAWIEGRTPCVAAPENTDNRCAHIERLACALAEAARPLRGAPDTAWFPAVLERTAEIATALQASVQNAPWPERISLEIELCRIQARLTDQRQRLAAQQEVADRLEAWVATRDIERLADWALNLTDAPEAISDGDPSRDLIRDLIGVRPALLEAMHTALRESGQPRAEQAAERLRQAAAGKSPARLPAMVEIHMRERRTDQVLAMVDDPEVLPTLDAETLSALNDYLLERLYLGRARRLRARVTQTTDSTPDTGLHPTVRRNAQRLPRSMLMHLAPLLIGIPVGAFVILDIGDAWNELLLPGHQGGLVTTIIATLLLAFLTLVGSLARQTSGDVRQSGVGGRLRWMLGLCQRSLPVFLGAWFFAILCSMALLLNLAGTSVTLLEDGADAAMKLPFIPQTLLWSGLSLFFGIFLGLIAQGRGLYGRKGSDEG